MQFLTNDSFKAFYKPNRPILTRQELEKTEYFPRQFNNFKDVDGDPRREFLIQNNKLTMSDWLDFVYEFYLVNLEDILDEVFSRRFSISHVDLNYRIQSIGTDGIIINKPFLNRFIKNVFFKEMFIDSHVQYGIDSKTYFDSILFEGKCLFSDLIVPSIFKTLFKNGWEKAVVSDEMVSMIRKRIFSMSVYSPMVYGSLLHSQKTRYLSHIKNNIDLLCPTASWGSPILALNSLSGYKSLTLVDVQSTVLEKCQDIYKYLNNQINVFGDGLEWSLETCCIPSQRMTDDHRIKSYDQIFFCPPYFDLEIYGGDNQSTNEFPDKNSWLDGYWRKTCQESSKILRPGGIFSFTIDAVNSPEMLSIAQENFEYLTTQKIATFTGKTSSSQKTNDSGHAYEHVHVLRKH